MQAIIQEYAAIGYTYTLTQEDKEQVVFEKWKQKFSDTYTYSIQNVFRVQHNGKEYIVYRIAEEVTGSDNIVHSCERRACWHVSPITQLLGTKNEYGEVDKNDLRITGYKLVYEIPFSKEFLRNLLDKSKQQPLNLCVGRGNNSPPDLLSSNPQSVFNEEEFVNCDFDDLFGASVGGFLRPEAGGVKAYQQSLKQQQTKQQQQNVTKS
jgi:hypothetical protein